MDFRYPFRTLRLHEAGILGRWVLKLSPEPQQCLELNNRRENELQRIALSHLTSAFVILGIGYLLALFCFIYEKIRKLFY